MEMQTHKQKVESLREFLIQAKSKGCFSLGKGKTSPNTMREYKKNGLKLDLKDFDEVLKIDPLEKTAFVEPKVTMEALFLKISPFGLIPKVLPEFKGITVGGAVNGAAIESSSFRFGQFNDTCLEYEILLGDGRVVTVTKESDPDIFYGISGSYGSLGIITGVKVSLMESKPFVHLQYTMAKSVAEAVHAMKTLSEQSDIDFLEAIVYSQSHTLIVTGKMIDAKPLEIPFLKLSKTYSPWYYQHLAKINVSEEITSLQDYLFRHDRAAFWMGGYALNPKILFRYILKHAGINSVKSLPDNADPLKEAPFLFRFLFGRMMDSKTLYKILHSGTEDWFRRNFCIQDYYLPPEKAASFSDTVLSSYKIAPLWICPVLSTNTPQIFSPHLCEKETLLFDVGVYGKPHGHFGDETVRALDLLCYQEGGKKMFYSYTGLSEEEFWQEYAKEKYDAIRKQYHAESVFHPITAKIL